MEAMTDKQKLKKGNNHMATANVDQDIEVFFYTDPLCCWSWAAKPQLDQLREMMGSRAVWHTRMGGLLPDWSNFRDETNSVSRPVQMGPVWMHAGQLAGRRIQHQLWFRDPPASSYPACVAVKCVSLQSESLGEYYLNFIRDACMLDGINIGKTSELFRLAQQMAVIHTSFDIDRFMDDFENGNGKNAFRHDLDFARVHNINRFPSLIIKHGAKAIMIPGYRTYAQLVNAVGILVPGLTAPLATS
jgi:putative protein-disulfide isomerase